MFQVAFLFGLAGAIAGAAVADGPVIQNTCAVTLCISGSDCKEVFYPSEGVIRAACLRPRPTGHENLCSDGQPLYVNSTRGIVEANCGETREPTNCPSGYYCNSDPTDRYAVCCPGVQPTPRPVVKPGECPAPGGLPCLRIQNCNNFSDSSCDGSQKCCKNRCGGYNCVAPAVRPSPSCQNTRCPPGQRCVMEAVVCKTSPCPPRPRCVPVVPEVRPGKCPVTPLPAPGAVGICASTCNRDGDCDGDQKCCRTRCGGRSCQSPVVEPRPSCQTVKCSAGYTCVMELPANCIFRKPCFEEPKCVPIQREGVCPRPVSGGLDATLSRPGGVCPRECATDAECPLEQKCCAGPRGCGTLCQNPEPSNTCANVECLPGQVCVMQEVQCIRAPCFPIPQCVPEPEKRCPAFPDFVDRRCKPVNDCSLAGSRKCPPGLSCCPTPCGLSCTRLG